MMGRSAMTLAVYCILIVISSLFGGWLPSMVRLTHVRMQVVLSFVGGLMLGVGLLHMVPHSYGQTGNLDTTLVWTLVGLLGMFFLIRTFHFHQHGPATVDPEAVEGEVAADAGSNDPLQVISDHRHSAQEHVHSDHCSHGYHAPLHSLSWVGVTFGLALHTFLDGVALSAAVLSDAAHDHPGMLAGVGVFVAILLHKPLDALSITTLMSAAHWSRNTQQLVNAGFAMMCPIGAWVFLLGVSSSGAHPHQQVGIALAISAGVFLCISLSDLLPEVQFHQHDRTKLSAALLFGVVVAYGMTFLEPAHLHTPQGNQDVLESAQPSDASPDFAR